jgi:hypothetical protein
MFADLSSEMLYTILPIFLTQALCASGSVVGLVEGIAQATQNTAIDPDTCGGLSAQYGCDFFQFTKTDGLYQRHLLFDSVKDPQRPGHASISRRQPVRFATSCLSAGWSPRGK